MYHLKRFVDMIRKRRYCKITGVPFNERNGRIAILGYERSLAVGDQVRNELGSCISFLKWLIGVVLRCQKTLSACAHC
jgi:hypothetical protein